LADGLRLCFEVKNRVGGPSVVIYSAYADRFLAAPAKIAQADALVSKTAPVSELLDASGMPPRVERPAPPSLPTPWSPCPHDCWRKTCP
jgi:hypothetical protein